MKFEYRPETDTLAVRLNGRAAADSVHSCRMAGVTVYHNADDQPLKLEIGSAKEFVKESLGGVFQEERILSLYEKPAGAGRQFAFSPEVDILTVLLSPEPYDYANLNEGVIAHYDISGRPVMLEIMAGRDFVRGAIAATMNKSHTAVVNGKTRKSRPAVLQNRAQEAAD